jgi:DNA repair exonuclease SbcCD nuclease subunit
MKFLFIGDVHVKTDNSEEIDILLLEIQRISKEFLFDYIVVGGDVMHYHERLFTQCLNKSIGFLKKLTDIAYTYVLVGNHDYINNSEFLSQNHWMNSIKNWKNLKIVDEVIEEKEFILCPYVYPGRFIEALETKTKDWIDKRIIFAHQEFKGCKMGAIISVDGDSWQDNYPYVISGHIHDNQKVGENIYYPGSPLQHAFGDSETRVLCHISLGDSKDKPEIIDIDLNVPKKRIVKANLSNIKDIIKNTKNTKNTEQVKIKLDTTNEEFKLFKETKEYKEMMNMGIKIQINKKKMDKNKDNKDEEKDEENNFTYILENMVKNDEPMVKSLYDEIILNKILITI